MHPIFSIAVLFMLAACASAGSSNLAPFIDIRSANFADMDNLTLCSIYSAHAFRSDEAKDELDRRKVLTEDDWKRVIDHKLYAGMPECAMVAAFGPADQRYLFRDAASGTPLQVEYLYDCVRTQTPDCPYTDVIVLNNKVLSWSAAQTTALLGQGAAPAPIPAASTPSYTGGGSETGGGGGGGGGGSGM